MGDSEKLEGADPARYGFLQHRRYVEDLLQKLGITDNVVLVGDDWGGALSMDWACRHPSAVRGDCLFRDAGATSGLGRVQPRRTRSL
jgi:haloalkane dehalogenase